MMTIPSHPRHLTARDLCRLFLLFALACGFASESAAQAAAPRRAGGAGAPRATGKPLTKAEVEQMWAKGAVEAFRGAVKSRGLAFEPDEEMLDTWTKKYPMQSAGASAGIKGDLTADVAPAPSVAEVEKVAPALLTRIRAAVQKRSDTELASIVHPDLLATKAKVYTLFDKTNYRNHSLGKFADAPYRRVGVPFYQLTTESQVEKLHHVQFALLKGAIVVRDVVSGAAVNDVFLKDEQALAVSRLQLVYRALNDKDDRALQNLLTPGLYDELKTNGVAITNGLPSVSQLTMTPKADEEGKSTRVVVHVSYLTRSNKKIDYDVDFEHIGDELKVVRLRDSRGDVIAVDPHINNYLGRRYNEPDGPMLDLKSIKRSEFPIFQSLERTMQQAQSALEDRNGARLREFAEIVADLAPESGYGLRASASYVLGQYEDAENAALRAIESGGTVYFPILHHVGKYIPGMTQSALFAPVVVAVSKEKVQYIPMRGQAARAELDIPFAAIIDVQFERGNVLRGGPRPFLAMKFKQGRDESTYNLAAFGTTCPDSIARGTAQQLIQYTGNTICDVANGAQVRTLVPPNWRQDLNVVLRTIEAARGKPAATRK
jgi:hypothetical protein